MPPRPPRCPNCRRYGASADKHLRVTPAGRAHYRCAKVPADAMIIGSNYIKVFRPAPTTVCVYTLQEIQKQVYLRAQHRKFLEGRKRQIEEEEQAKSDNLVIEQAGEALFQDQVSAHHWRSMFMCCNEGCFNDAHLGYNICRECLEKSSTIVCMEVYDDDHEGSE